MLRALELLRSEVDRVMALIGCNSIAELGPEYLCFDGMSPVSADGGARRSHAA